MRKQLIVSPDISAKVTTATVGQRHNPLWSMIRKNRLTASNFGAVLGAIERNRFPVSLQKRLTPSYNLDGVKSIAWGISQEATAIEMYSQLGAKVVQSGIWIHESGVLGASPDGIVIHPPSPSSNIHHQSDIAKRCMPDFIEVKCPFNAKEMTVQEAIVNIKGFCLVQDRDGDMKHKTHMITTTRYRDSCMWLGNAAVIL